MHPDGIMEAPTSTFLVTWKRHEGMCVVRPCHGITAEQMKKIVLHVMCGSEDACKAEK